MLQYPAAAISILLLPAFFLYIPGVFWGSAPTDISNRSEAAHEIRGTASIVARALVQNIPQEETCYPDFLACITDNQFATRCPGSCEGIRQVAELLANGTDEDVAAWLLSRMGGMEDLASSEVYLRRDSLASPKAASLAPMPCGDCPHVSCCVAYPATVAEALLMRAGLAETNEQPTSHMFQELAWQQIKTWFRWLPFSHSNPFGYYSSTVKFYGEKSRRVDLGWVNEYLGTIETYYSHGGVHAYRKVPRNADGTLDVDFATAQLPETVGRPLVIGLVADWGCDNAGARRVMEELAKQKPDVLLHLGDTYYSGTEEEQRKIILEPLRELLDGVPVFVVPGNHDYYSNGSGFFKLLDELANMQAARQEASFVALRGHGWQILMLDTGLLDSFQLNGLAAALPLGRAWEKLNRNTMPFLPDDQLEWALKQIEIGEEKGLRTILMSHHQLFSRRESIGYAHGEVRERAFHRDLKAGVYETSQWQKSSRQLPGGLPEDVPPAANTRLLDQFPKDVLQRVSAWYWGHEHSSAIFEPYAELQRGRLIGNGCIPTPKPPLWNPYGKSPKTEGGPWGGRPQVINGSQVGTGNNFWNLGFTTISLEAGGAHARYFELEDFADGDVTGWKNARMFFEEDLQ